MMRLLLKNLRTAISAVQPIVAATTPIVRQLGDGLCEEGPETALNNLVSTVHGAMSQHAAPVRAAIQAVARVAYQPTIRSTVERRIRTLFGKQRTKLLGDPRAAVFLRYLDDLERDIPGIAVVVAIQTLHRARSMALNAIRLLWLNQKYESRKGERKAEALRGLTLHVTEHLHQPIIRPLEWAERIRREQPLEVKTPYGKLIADLRKWASALEDLLPADAAHWRNAAAHFEGWKNSADFQSLHLKDAPRPDKVWTAELAVEDLYSRLDRLVESLVIYFRCLWQVLAERAITFTDRTPIMNRLAQELGVDAGHVPSNQELEAAFEEFFAPLLRRTQANRSRNVVEPGKEPPSLATG